ERGSGRGARFTPKDPEPGKKRESCERAKVLRPGRIPDVPARINYCEICRPKEIAQIKPKQPARNQTTVDQGKIKRLVMLGTKLLLDPNGHNPGEQRDAKKWNEWFQSADPG